mmetsp:Transcript_26929/g.79904  ORF Transcript_26929/g.79904 Transcript_26929/m.79904 type:complete len:211 (-) Transcript_26929:595-1227(-)
MRQLCGVCRRVPQVACHFFVVAVLAGADRLSRREERLAGEVAQRPVEQAEHAGAQAPRCRLHVLHKALALLALQLADEGAGEEASRVVTQVLGRGHTRLLVLAPVDGGRVNGAAGAVARRRVAPLDKRLEEALGELGAGFEDVGAHATGIGDHARDACRAEASLELVRKEHVGKLGMLVESGVEVGQEGLGILDGHHAMQDGRHGHDTCL